MEASARTCPDCERSFADPSALVDHSLTEHVAVETPAAAIRRPKHRGSVKAIAAISMLFGLAVVVLVGVAATGAFDKATVAETPNSVVHKMVVDLKTSGEIDDYRAVEPDSGWDTEYEVNGGDGWIHVRNEGGAYEELEVFGFGGLGDALEDEAEERGFNFGA